LIYLDTHAVVYLHLNKPKEFPEKVKEFMNANEWVISPMVQLELEYLHEIGRLKSPSAYVVQNLKRISNLTLCPKPFAQVAKEATSHNWTRDPFDRIIVAQASLSNDILVTRDRNILDNYSKAFWG